MRRPSPAFSHARQKASQDTVAALGFLDRSRRHLHRRGRTAAGRLADRAQAAVGEPGGLSRRRRAGHPRPARPESRRADPAGPRRRGEDGHHGRHQCAARAQGRPHAAADHQGLPRRAQDRLPGAAEDFRPPHHQAGHAVRARRRGRRARARRRHGRARARSRRGAADLEAAKADGIDAVAIVFMHAYRYPEHEQHVAALAREHGFRAGVGQPRGLAADQAGRPRRHHGGRCLSVADPAALCGAGGQGSRRQALAARG